MQMLPWPVRAIVLNLMDLLDARLEQAFRLIGQAPAGDEFTPYVPSLERQLFRGFRDEVSPAAGQASAPGQGGGQP